MTRIIATTASLTILLVLTGCVLHHSRTSPQVLPNAGVKVITTDQPAAQAIPFPTR